MTIPELMFQTHTTLNMRKQCKAFLPNPSRQCSKSALTGTIYCYLHYPLKGPVIAFLIGMVVSLGGQELYDRLTTSEAEARLATVESKLDSFTKLATRFYPTVDPNTALDRLRKDIETLKGEQNRIKTFSSEIEVLISGKWSKTPGTIISLSPATNTKFVGLIDSQDNETGAMFGLEPYRFEDKGSTSSVFRCRQAVRDGGFPISGKLDELLKIKKMRFYVPFIYINDKIEGGLVYIQQVNVKLFVNGVAIQEFILRPPAVAAVPLKKPGWAIFDMSLPEEFSKLVPSTI